MLDEYGKKDENGKLVHNKQGSIEFEDGNYDIFMEKHAELLDIEVECTRLSVSELGDKVELSANDLVILDELLTE